MGKLRGTFTIRMNVITFCENDLSSYRINFLSRVDKGDLVSPLLWDVGAESRLLAFQGFLEGVRGLDGLHGFSPS